eukprot:CAMPEP_0171099838 /NCGR_PEP_ID=MMETSP0766_2-20121228/52602_1 /TAXON_ID=439317 /ORGANISM="Gambierdiscus australes, Strain CAWD 149" /LENGTH=52 /DNA_ID=CAMNT_0011559555 /DNA_START=57 /DNA_END=212 /DNA_ORIENTATION=-
MKQVLRAQGRLFPAATAQFAAKLCKVMGEWLPVEGGGGTGDCPTCTPHLPPP